MATVNPHFPDDLLIEIFLKLPVRSLFAFSSVSKHWLRLIQSPNFIHLRLSLPITDDHDSLLVIHDIDIHSSNRKKVFTLMSGAYKEDLLLEALSPSMACKYLQVYLLGPCNGLIGISNSRDIMVFNPVTRQRRQVPRSPSRNQVKYFSRICFGFDSVSNEHKIVGFDEIYVREDGDDDDDDPRFRLGISIYRFGTNSWTQLNDSFRPTSYWSVYRDYDTFFNGAFHWLAYLNSKNTMIVFDLNKEALKLFELPGYFTTNEHLDLFISVLDECMAVIMQSGINCFRNQVNEIEIWVMKDYGVYSSRTKLYNIDIRAVLDIQGTFPSTTDGEFLFLDRHGELVSFNINTRVIKRIASFKEPIYALRFRESLVSPWRS